MGDAVDGEGRKQLRVQAESRLGEGTAPCLRGWPAGIDALDLLHQLASTPERAADALRLLHELQVHQVELDLQHEHMEAEREEQAADLAHYMELFERAPVAYVLVDSFGVVIKANHAAAELFGVPVDTLTGRALERRLGPAGRSSLAGLLAQLAQRGGQASCTVDCVPTNSRSTCALEVWANAAPQESVYRLVLTTRIPNGGAPTPA